MRGHTGPPEGKILGPSGVWEADHERDRPGNGAGGQGQQTSSPRRNPANQQSEKESCIDLQ